MRWTLYQTAYPLPDELDDWFDDGQYGIGLVCGHVSGDLEVIDFEDPTLFDQWRPLVEAQAPGLLARLPVVATPRPGRHVYYRCNSVEGSRKLARTADGQTLIESKGEGGYVLAPGSPDACHPTGRTYEHLSGSSLSAIPVITTAERTLLHDAARSFDAHARDDQRGRPAHPQQTPAATPTSAALDRRIQAYLDRSRAFRGASRRRRQISRSHRRPGRRFRPVRRRGARPHPAVERALHLRGRSPLALD